MCFYIRNTEESRTLWVAKEDIVCYKYLLPGYRKPETPMSPFEYFKYTMGKVYKEKKFRIPSVNKEGIYKFDHKDMSYSIIEKRRIPIYNGFHSYTTISGAFRNKYVESKIYKCIIPKGSEFYYDPVLKQYCSNQIKIVKKLT